MPIGQTSIPVLAQAEDAVASKVPEQFKTAFAKVVQAGLTIMHAPSLAAAMHRRLAQGSDPAKDAGMGAARMMGELFKQSGKTIPSAVVMPAAIVFICEYLDMLSKANGTQITPDILADATQVAGHAILTAAGVKPEDIKQAIAAQQGKPKGIIAGQRAVA